MALISLSLSLLFVLFVSSSATNSNSLINLENTPYPLLCNLLKSLGELYETKDLHTAAMSSSLVECFGCAISAMGPEKFLSILPLNLQCDEKEYLNGIVLCFSRISHQESQYSK